MHLDREQYQIRIGKSKSLVLWSGGLDSTWTLVKLLRETDDEVFAHHVHKRSRTDDGKRLSYLFEAEREAIRAMRPWLAENERPFTYSESAVDLTAFPRFARDITTTLFFGVQAAMSWGLQPSDRILTGANRDEDQIEGGDMGVHYRNTFRRLANRMLAQSVMQSDTTPKITYLEPAPSRQEQIDYLAGPLLEMTISCRDPQPRSEDSFAPCGVCPTCRSLASVKLPA